MFQSMISPLLASLLVTLARAQSGPTVNITQGSVVGLNATDGNYFMFYGIPYAGNPSGANRFKAPTAAPTFPGPFYATDISKVCAQPTSKGLVGTEDCLVLNVYTKNLTSSKPVMVWIDGEDYTTTSRNLQFSYKNFVERDVVIVTINYRLSIFGFLCLGVEEAPGNAGLKDVVAGLQWIKQNIASFGGDPNNVVLFGHGSGAAMVDLLTLSQLSAGLFHKAIASSGSALAPWAVAYEPVRYAEALGRELGYTGKSRAELAKSLAGTDINVLATAISNFQFINNTALFAPCIENVDLQPNNTFLHDAPIHILRSGNYSHVPFLTGFVDREGTARAQQALFSGWLTELDANFTKYLQADLTFPSEANKTAVAGKIRNFYFGTKAISRETIDDFLDYEGDTMYIVSTIRGAKERTLTSKQPVYLYQFKFRGTQNSDWALPITLTGARHGVILNFLFDYDLATTDADVKQSLVSRWTAFTYTGVPINETIHTIMWPAMNSTGVWYLDYTGEAIGPNQTIAGESYGSNPHKESMDFWDEIYKYHYAAPNPVSSGQKLIGVTFSVLISFIIVSLFN